MEKRYCLALDLKADPDLIAAYERHHQQVWPEVLASIADAGILRMEIYRIDNRLVMMMETNESFSFEKKQEADAQNSKVQEWETLMWEYQQGLPTAVAGQKWMLMDCIFAFVAAATV